MGELRHLIGFTQTEMQADNRQRLFGVDPGHDCPPALNLPGERNECDIINAVTGQNGVSVMADPPDLACPQFSAVAVSTFVLNQV